MKKFALFATPFAAFAVLALAACDNTLSPAETPSYVLPGIYVLGQKYGDAGSSSLQRIAGGSIADATPSRGMPAHSNTGIDVVDSVLFVLDRTAGTATGFLLGGTFSSPILDQNVGSSSNPQNIAKIDGRNWVARYGSASLIGFKAGTSNMEIDLSSYDEKTASVPYAMAVKAWNSRLVVVLQRLDASYSPADDSSLVLVIDPTSREVQKRIALPFQNPYDTDLRGDILALGCTGGWSSSTDGGLVLVDLAQGVVTKSFPATDLGGDPSSVAFASNDRVWAGIDLGWPNTKARPVDIASGAIGSAFEEATAVADLAFDGTSLWIANHDDDAPYVYEIDPATGSKKSRHTATLAPGALKILK